MLQNALEYADRGWRVFPCHSLVDGKCSCGKECKREAKHPRTANGLKEASCRESTIKSWWRQWPDANIGCTTSGFFVLDVDDTTELARLEKEHGELPGTRASRTGRGGIHLFFKMPEGIDIRNSTGKVRKGIDVRGTGGYVLLPPSLHKSGRRYEWINDEEIMEAPSWLIDLAIKEHTEGTEKKRRKKLVPHGERHEFLVSEGGKLRRIGYEPDQIARNLEYIFTHQCEQDPPPPKGYFSRVAKSLEQYKPATDYLLSDMGNAERFADMWGDKIAYCDVWKKWLIWDGTRWTPDTLVKVQEYAMKTVLNIKEQGNKEKDIEKQKAIFSWWVKSQDSKRIKSIASLASGKLSVSPEDFDKDPWKLNVKNGTIDLKTGKLEPHTQENLITKLAPCTFDHKAKCPRFMKFMHDIFGGRTEIIEFLQRVFGYSLSGEVRERIFVIFHGIGRNGKSTLLELIHDLLGDYALTTRPETLLQRERGSGGIPNDIARLKGARFVYAKEPEKGAKISSAVKEMTGQDTLTARFLHAEFFDFKPNFKLFLGTNHKPRVPADDQAFWDRIRLVPFDVRLKTKTDPEGTIEEDTSLPKKLRAELPGILNWCIEGCLLWQREGLTLPDDVDKATRLYRRGEDFVGDFLSETCTIEEDGKCQMNLLYHAYKDWCNETGHRCLGAKALKEVLIGKGFRIENGTWLELRLEQDTKVENF